MPTFYQFVQKVNIVNLCYSFIMSAVHDLHTAFFPIMPRAIDLTIYPVAQWEKMIENDLELYQQEYVQKLSKKIFILNFLV